MILIFLLVCVHYIKLPASLISQQRSTTAIIKRGPENFNMSLSNTEKPG